MCWFFMDCSCLFCHFLLQKLFDLKKMFLYITRIMGPLNATPRNSQFDPSISTDIFNIPDVLNVPDIPIIIYISSSLWFQKGMILDIPSETVKLVTGNL